MFYVFLLSLCLIFFIYLGYPILLLLISIIKKEKIDKNDNFYPSVSLIISSYNEEGIIEEKIKNSLQLDYPKELLEVIIASESTDNTNSIVRKYEDRGIKLIASANREGKPATLYKVVPLSKGDILVFSDTNAMYDKMAIKKLVRNFYDKRVGCVTGKMRYKNPNNSNSGKGESVYWNYENLLRKLSSGVITGSIFALRRDAYFPLSKFRGDDFELSMNAAINGYKVVFDEDAHSFEEVYENTEKEYTRKVRVISWNFESALMLFRESVKKMRFSISFKILFHKILRWLVPFYLIILFFSNLFLILQNESSAYTYFFLCQSLLYLSALVSLVMERMYKVKLPGVFWFPYYFCMVNYAAVIGTGRMLLGKTGRLWEVNR